MLMCPNEVYDYITKRENDKVKCCLKKLGNYCNTGVGLKLMHYSASHSNSAMVQYLIEEGCHVDVQDIHGSTPLMLAVNKKDPITVQILLNYNADIYHTNHYNESSLHLAIRCRFYDTYLQGPSHSVFKLFFDKINKDFLTDKLRITQFLLNADNLVKLAIVAYGNYKLAEFMLKHGYEINYRQPKRNFTALVWSIILGKIKNAKILIDHGANNVEPIDDYSLLYYYTWNFESVDKESRVLKTLIKTNWDLSKNRDAKFVVSEAEKLLIKGNKDTVREVLKSGINVVSMNFKSNRTFLHVLVQNVNCQDLDLLTELDIKFDVNALSKYGTALSLAIQNCCLKKIEFLLEHGTDVNLTLPGRDCDSHLIRVFRYLFLRGMEIREAEKSILEKTVELLLQHGADVQKCWLTNEYIIQVVQNYPGSQYARLIIAHLALLETFDTPALKNFVRHEIQSINLTSKAQFELFKRQIEKMKNTVVNGKITLLKLLTDKRYKVVAYGRNQEFIVAFNSRMATMSNIEFYYRNTLQRKVSKALITVVIQKEAAPVIELLTGLCSDVYHVIVYKIINYLDTQTLSKLKVLYQ